MTYNIASTIISGGLIALCLAAIWQTAKHVNAAMRASRQRKILAARIANDKFYNIAPNSVVTHAVTLCRDC